MAVRAHFVVAGIRQTEIEAIATLLEAGCWRCYNDADQVTLTGLSLEMLTGQ